MSCSYRKNVLVFVESPPDDDFYAPWSYSYSRPEGADSVFAFRVSNNKILLQASVAQLDARPTGNQEVAGSASARSATFFRGV